MASQRERRLRNLRSTGGAIVLDPGVAEKLLELPFAPHRFFLLPDHAVFVPAARLSLSRCRPDGVLNANKLMMKAYHNETTKRAPISVRAMGRGRFEVVDGNSTTVNCLLSGWAAVPVTIESEAR